MKRLSKLAIAISSTLASVSIVCASSIPNTDNPTTFLGPTARLGYTSTLNNSTAYSLAGEAGIKNFRVGGTIGFKLAENQLFKISAEYLWQKITYAFFSGDTNQWVNQGAVGAAYQYEFVDNSYKPQLGISGYFSHAPSKTLNDITGTYVNSQGFVTSFVDSRRIAGSNAAGVSPGISIAPWNGGRVGAEINYDNVRYDTRNAPNEDAKGLGGTLKLNQALTDNIDLGASAAVRQPFNNYAANLDWNHVPFYGDWTLGLFGDYTVGKNTLPNTWNLGLSANYFLDQRCPVMIPANLKGEADLKAEMVSQPINDNLLAWTADPAVYMPQVLAIVDERVTNTCTADVRLVSPIPDQGTFRGDGSFSVASNFSGSNITYSLTTVPVSPDADGNAVTIDSAGVIHVTTAVDSTETFTVTVTASNGCSSASSRFTIPIDTRNE